MYTRLLAFSLAASVVVIGTHAAQPSAALPQFTDVTTTAGIHFKHTSGAFGKKYLPETLGAGVAFLDADGDGWQDLLFINGRKWPGQSGAAAYPALYHNTVNGTFTDITRTA